MSELEEERRLAYVGITRARKRLYVSRAVVRVGLGGAAAQSRQPFPRRDPGPLVDWRRTEQATPAGEARPPRAGPAGLEGPGRLRLQPTIKTIPSLQAGDRVLHTTFGMGTVVATSGGGTTRKPMSTSARPGSSGCPCGTPRSRSYNTYEPGFARSGRQRAKQS